MPSSCTTSCLYLNSEPFMVKIRRWQIRVIFIWVHGKRRTWTHIQLYILIVLISFVLNKLNWKIIQGKCKKPLAACLCDLPLSSNRYLYDLVWYTYALSMCSVHFSFPLITKKYASNQKKDFYDKIQEWTPGQNFIQ